MEEVGESHHWHGSPRSTFFWEKQGYPHFGHSVWSWVRKFEKPIRIFAIRVGLFIARISLSAITVPPKVLKTEKRVFQSKMSLKIPTSFSLFFLRIMAWEFNPVAKLNQLLFGMNGCNLEIGVLGSVMMIEFGV